MLQFYQRFFPFRLFFHWLNQSPNPTTSFSHREIAFTLQNDAYLRYQSFPNIDAFKKELLRLNPSRFEIGPVYSADPKDRKLLNKSQFKPLRKELVFDIDLTDYDDIRKCCTGKSICLKCWQFITVAIKVLDAALRDDFGFKHILWVYSGRRGAHAWVCDKRAQVMDDTKRRAVASYLQLRKGGGSDHSLLKRPLHPHIERSLKILSESFKDDILLEQNPWASPQDAELLLARIYDKTLVRRLRETWNKESNSTGGDDISSLRKWDDITTIGKEVNDKAFSLNNLVNTKMDIILDSMYPRLDIEVSKHLNHLLKSPFCVHPSTGRVCVPIDVSKVEKFNPLMVPTVSRLFNDLDKYTKDSASQVDADESSSSSTVRLSDAEKTSLAPYIKYFKEFTSKLVNENLHEKRQRDENSKPISSVDF